MALALRARAILLSLKNLFLFFSQQIALDSILLPLQKPIIKFFFRSVSSRRKNLIYPLRNVRGRLHWALLLW